MTKQEQLRYEYFIETGIVWIDTNDNIEMDYLKWVENKALTIPDVSQHRELLDAFCCTMEFDVKHETYEEDINYFLENVKADNCG